MEKTQEQQAMKTPLPLTLDELKIMCLESEIDGLKRTVETQKYVGAQLRIMIKQQEEK